MLDQKAHVLKEGWYPPLQLASLALSFPGFGAIDNVPHFASFEYILHSN
jgi:hypothetical protein